MHITVECWSHALSMHVSIPGPWTSKASYHIKDTTHVARDAVLLGVDRGFCLLAGWNVWKWYGKTNPSPPLLCVDYGCSWWLIVSFYKLLSYLIWLENSCAFSAQPCSVMVVFIRDNSCSLLSISLLQQMTADIVVQLKNWLSCTSTHYSWRLIWPQAKRIILVGKRPQEESLPMNIGKQWNWKSLLWKESLTMLYQVLGLSSASDIQMDLLKSSKLGSVHEAISNSKESISLKLVPQLSNGQQ